MNIKEVTCQYELSRAISDLERFVYFGRKHLGICDSGGHTVWSILIQDELNELVESKLKELKDRYFELLLEDIKGEK